MKVSFFAWVSCLSAFGWVAAAQQEIIFSESTVFQLFIEEGNFSNAVENCEDLNEGNNRFKFSLARIDSKAVFDFIVNEFGLDTLELNSTSVDEINRQSIWIGLRRGSFNTFQFVDGVNVDTSFFSSHKEFPWDGTQPNGGVTQSNDDDDDTIDTQSAQDCVSWERLALVDGRSNLTWYDDDCEATMSAFLCRGEELGTPSPTINPPVRTDSNDSLLATVFLSVAAIASMMIVLLVFLIVREKNTLKMLYRELEALPAKRSDDRIEMFDENDGEAFYLPRA